MIARFVIGGAANPERGSRSTARFPKADAGLRFLRSCAGSGTWTLQQAPAKRRLEALVRAVILCDRDLPSGLGNALEKLSASRRDCPIVPDFIG
jgi:hypothetical protein